MAKMTVGQLLGFNDGHPFRVTCGTVMELAFVTKGWSGEGNSLTSHELTKAECYTKVTVGWHGGAEEVKLPPSLGDVSRSIPDEAFVVVLTPQRSKRGQLRDMKEHVEIIGVGLSSYDADMAQELLAVPGSENGVTPNTKAA